MKNIRIAALLVLAFTVASVYSCRSTDLIPEIPILDYSIIGSDTIKTRNDSQVLAENSGKTLVNQYNVVTGDTIIIYSEPKLNPKTTKDVGLDKLKDENNEDNSFRMIAVGGSLTAGFRDGGYFNEGIKTSYPNLIARQMGIDFSQPYFDAGDYNGIGRKVGTTFNPTRGPVPKTKLASNNLALVSNEDNKIRLKKYSGDIDNYAIPGNNLAFMYSSEINESMDGNKGEPLNSVSLKRKNLAPFALRIQQRESSLEKEIKSKRYDLVLLEIGYDDILNSLNEVGGTGVNSGLGINFIKESIARIKQSENTKVCLSTLPSMGLTDYFSSITTDMIEKGAFNQTIYMKGDENINPAINYRNYFNENSFYMPSSAIDSLLSPVVNIALKPGINKERPLSKTSVRNSIFWGNDKRSRSQYDKAVEAEAKLNGYALADIRGLYLKILDGNYREDGILIDARWPEGNFFSSDGLFPSALGQALIANEFIRALNRTYKSKIPLVSIRELL